MYNPTEEEKIRRLEVAILGRARRREWKRKWVLTEKGRESVHKTATSDAGKARQKKYSRSEKGRATRKEWADRLRTEIFNHYGNSCKCCGESTKEFLCIDHIDNGRGNPATRHGMGITFYHWLKKNGYPAGLQTLCHNCNASKGLFGRCPHNRGV
jgi:hypothetical protein